MWAHRVLLVETYLAVFWGTPHEQHIDLLGFLRGCWIIAVPWIPNYCNVSLFWIEWRGFLILCSVIQRGDWNRYQLKSCDLKPLIFAKEISLYISMVFYSANCVSAHSTSPTKQSFASSSFFLCAAAWLFLVKKFNAQASVTIVGGTPVQAASNEGVANPPFSYF